MVGQRRLGLCEHRERLDRIEAELQEQVNVCRTRRVNP